MLRLSAYCTHRCQKQSHKPSVRIVAKSRCSRGADRGNWRVGRRMAGPVPVSCARAVPPCTVTLAAHGANSLSLPGSSKMAFARITHCCCSLGQHPIARMGSGRLIIGTPPLRRTPPGAIGTPPPRCKLGRDGAFVSSRRLFTSDTRGIAHPSTKPNIGGGGGPIADYAV